MLSSRPITAGVRPQRGRKRQSAPHQLSSNAIWILCPAIFFLSAAPGPPQIAPVGGLTSAAIIQFLDQTIEWYRQLEVERQLAREPNDALLVSENQQIANEVAGLAFDFARTAAESIEKHAGTSQEQNASAETSQHQALIRLSSSIDQQVREIRAEVESLKQKLAAASGGRLRTLQTQIAETQSELDLAEARRDALRSMAGFTGGSNANGLGAIGLRPQIEELARAIPALSAKPSGGSGSTPVASTWQPAPSGVWGLTQDMFALSRKIRSLNNAIRLTEALSQKSNSLHAPLIDLLKQASARGDELAKQADSASPSVLTQEKKELDALTAEFKTVSAIALPLGRQGVLLDLYRRNLLNWQGTIKNQYTAELSSLLIRLALLAAFLAAVIAAAEFWRRTIFRYVHEVRRRHQYLLVRRIVLWCVIALILVFSFANQLSSMATFAGLMTAGVAVALQSVILSVAGYFFLIGRFGIRVGDRVNVSGVTGEVVDIGLVRFHLLEMVSGEGVTPTGRVVAFSNTIVFQSGAGLFKQIPGTNFVWHEVTVTLSPDSDYRAIEERLRAAVEAVFSEYQEEIEEQHRNMERTLNIVSVGALRPRTRLRLTQPGIEVVIVYPVDMVHAAEIDDRVARELLKARNRDDDMRRGETGDSPVRLDTNPSA